MRVIGEAMSGADLRRAREAGLRANPERKAELDMERRRLISIFQTYDKDGDGKLTTHEFEGAMRRVNVDFTERQAQDLSRRVAKNSDGLVEWGDFCDRFTAAAETLQVSQAMKQERWQDNGAILAHHSGGGFGTTSETMDMETTHRTEHAPLRRDDLPPAGTHSSKFMNKDRAPLLFDEWDSLRSGARRGRGASAFQSSGLRFDERGFQTGTRANASRPHTAEPPRAHRATVTRPAASVRECLQPELVANAPKGLPSPPPKSDVRVLRLKEAPPPP